MAGTIEVKLFRRDGCWICSVTDDWIGISETARPRIFERFFKEDKRDKQAVGGAGWD